MPRGTSNAERKRQGYWPTIEDGSLRAKTGKVWSEWFALLDAWGGPEKGHKAMAKMLLEEHGLTSWWSQTVVVEFERTRGLRAVNQTPEGFEFSVTRTIAAPLERVWAAWTVAAEWDRWFSSESDLDLRVGGRYSNADGDSGEFKTVAAMRRIRFTWEQARHQPGSVVEVLFAAKPDGRSEVVVSHTRLSGQDEVADLREGWSWAMDSLKSYLEIGKPVRWEDWKASRS